MKITLEPTADQSNLSSSQEMQHGVTVTHPSDYLELNEVVELFKGALVAWGFHPTSVEGVLGPDEDE